MHWPNKQLYFTMQYKLKLILFQWLSSKNLTQRGLWIWKTSLIRMCILIYSVWLYLYLCFFVYPVQCVKVCPNGEKRKQSFTTKFNQKLTERQQKRCCSSCVSLCLPTAWHLNVLKAMSDSQHISTLIERDVTLKLHFLRVLIMRDSRVHCK